MGDQGGIENDPGVKGVRQRLWTDRPGVDGGGDREDGRGICELYRRVGRQMKKSREHDKLPERVDPGSTQGRPRVDPMSTIAHVII